MDKEAPEKRLVDWAIIEQIGIPMTVLAGIAYGISKVWVWLSESLIKEIRDSSTRVENIVIQLINNSKQERELNREHMKEILIKLENTLNIIGKLSGNGISHLFKKGKEKV